MRVVHDRIPTHGRHVKVILGDDAHPSPSASILRFGSLEASISELTAQDE